MPAKQQEIERLRHELQLIAGMLERATDRQRVSAQDAEVSRHQEIDLPADLQDVLRLRREVVKEEARIWSLRDAVPLAHLRERLQASRLRIITVGNLKGGVGKTTLTANLAAFFEKKMGKRVLVIDLDYQGSLSAMMLQSAGKTIDYSQTEHLLNGTVSGKALLDIAKDLAPKLANTRIVPAGYTLQDVEDQLMMRWLLHTTDKDVRFNLAEVLLSQVVQEKFDVVLLDVGPRLTTASISALCASTHLIVPTNLDALAVETIGGFLRQVRRIKSDLRLAVEVAGVVGTMTYRDELTAAETDARGSIIEASKTLEDGQSAAHIFQRTIPRRNALAGADIGYLLPGANGAGIRSLFDALAQEVATRINLQ